MTRVYFIATKHKRYAQAVYLPNSTVIDPWRYLPRGKHWEVHRVGENKPEIISVLVPSRGRPEMFERMYRSLAETAIYPRQVEVVAMLDDDDETKAFYPADDGHHRFVDTSVRITYAVGPRCLLSQAWNNCVPYAKGSIFMHCGDDLTFNTTGWDERVREEFAKIPDRIALVYGDDLSTNFPDLATHGFVHRRWVDTIGYFLPPLFSSDWNDVWISEVAQKIGRMVPMPDVVIEHHHYSFAKAEYDQTHREREERGARDDVVGLYKKTAPERKRDAKKLEQAIAAYPSFAHSK